MKKFSINVNRSNKIASISLNAIKDFDQGNQVHSLERIAELFISRKIYVAYLKASNINLVFDAKKNDVIIVKSHKWYDLIAIRIDNGHLNDIIKKSTQNEERTEVYYIDEFGWDDFLRQECRLKYNEYRAVLVVNDNGQTFVNFSLEAFNLDEITARINAILEDIF
ncbi:MAG: hypothetical protein PHR89_01850 [Bacilli bacterium]|nr:hypothetical protein [Bacilli bacterium]